MYWRDSPHWLGIKNYDFRARRIIGLLKGKKKLSVEDMKLIQNDVHLIPAENIVPHLVRICRAAQLSGKAVDALGILEKWDYQMRIDEVAPSVFVKWVERFKVNLLSNYTDDSQLRDYLTLQSIMRMIVADEDTNGLGVQGCVVQSLIEAVEKLCNEYSSEISEWKWGKINSTNITHPLGAKISEFNQPQLPADGYSYCVNPGAGRNVYSNASWRHIIDVGDKTNSLCILPGGESGVPASKHYGDQLELYLDGRYKTMTMPERPEDV